MELMQEMEKIVKGGIVDGGVLYLTSKIVDVSDQAAFNMLGANLPGVVRTPLVGLALATGVAALSDHWLAEKASEYLMANAVASAISTVGSLPGQDSGPLDQQINAMVLPIANIGLPAGAVPFTSATFWGVPGNATRGYIPSGATRGYVQGRTGGYVSPRTGAGMVTPASPPLSQRQGILSQRVPSGAPGGSGTMRGGLRSSRLRGYTTELN